MKQPVSSIFGGLQLTEDALDRDMPVISLEVLDQDDIHYKASVKLEYK